MATLIIQTTAKQQKQGLAPVIEIMEGDKSYLEPLVNRAIMIFENAWINDDTPAKQLHDGKPLNDQLKIDGRWPPLKRQVATIMAKAVLPNGGVLVEWATDALTDLIASREQAVKASPTPALKTDRNGQQRIF